MFQQFMETDIISGAVLFFCLVYLVCTRVFGKPLSASKTPNTLWIIDLIVWPIGIVAFYTVLTELLSFISATELLALLPQVQSLTMHLAFFWLLARGVDLLFFQWYVFHRTGFKTPGLLIGMNYVLFFIAALSLFLHGIGYPITGFLVSTGVVAGILGLALQSTLNDLFSGIALSLDKPFQIGEWIEFEDKTVGQVIDLTWRSTRIRTFSSTLLSVPNSVMAKSPITNLDRPDKMFAAWYQISISSEVDPKLVVTVISTAVGHCSGILRKPNPTVRLSDASGAPYVYSIWVHYPSYLGHFHGQEQLYTDVNRSLKAAGISPAGKLQEVKYSRASPINPVDPSIADTLRSMDIFSELEDKEIEHIAASSEYVLVTTDTILLEENTSSTHVHVVVNGSLESSIELNDGERAISDQLDVGDSFGWAAIVTDEKAIMTVRATSDSLLLVIEAECLRPILHDHDALQQRFISLVTERVKRLSNIRSDVCEKRSALSPTELRRRIERFIAGG